jgi:hypothetical protein
MLISAAPLQHQAREVAARDHQLERLARCEHGKLGAQLRNAGEQWMRSFTCFAPLAGLAARHQILQPVFEPGFGRLALGEREDLGGGHGVPRIVEPAQARQGEHGLGLLQQAGLRGRDGDALRAEAVGEIHHLLIRSRQHRDVAEACRTVLAAVPVHDLSAGCEQLPHALPQRHDVVADVLAH